MIVARRYVISGRVQGVGFRYWTCELAEQLGLGGWVRNLGDGRVEAVFEGPDESVERMVRWCHRGPPGAEVGEVEVLREEPEGVLGFEVRR